MNQEINELVQAIQHKKQLRIIGHSGIGKTRRVYESIIRLPKDQQDKIAYCLASDILHQNLIEFLHSNMDSDLTLILDDCPEILHQRIENILKQSKCNIKLISIDYEIPYGLDDKKAKSNSIIEVLPLEDKVISGMLRAKFPDLLEAYLYIIQELAQGYPIIAFLLSQNLENSGRISNFTKEDLVKKLLWRRDEQPNEQKEKILSVCSLFTYLGFEGELKKQSRQICTLFNIPFDDFYATVQEFKSKKIIQSRGAIYISFSKAFGFLFGRKMLAKLSH